jgi:hypothetical protein
MTISWLASVDYIIVALDAAAAVAAAHIMSCHVVVIVTRATPFPNGG